MHTLRTESSSASEVGTSVLIIGAFESSKGYLEYRFFQYERVRRLFCLRLPYDVNMFVMAALFSSSLYYERSFCA